MTRQELLKKINRARSLKVSDRLNIENIVLSGIHAKFYKDMNKQFLKNISTITGTRNGLLISEDNETLSFIINTAYENVVAFGGLYGYPVISFNLSFDLKTGFCKGISDVTYRRDFFEQVNSTDAATVEEETKAVENIKPVLKRFLKIANGNNFQYLIPTLG